MIEILTFVSLLRCPAPLVARQFENRTRHRYELSVLVGKELYIGPLVFAAGGGVTMCLPRDAWTVSKRGTR